MFLRSSLLTVALSLSACGGDAFLAGDDAGPIVGAGAGDSGAAAGGAAGSTGGAAAGSGGASAGGTAHGAGGVGSGGDISGGSPGSGGRPPGAGGASTGGAASGGTGAGGSPPGAGGAPDGYSYEGCGRLFSLYTPTTEDDDVVCEGFEVHCNDWVTTFPRQRCYQLPTCARQTTGSGTCGAIEHPHANLDAYLPGGCSQICPEMSAADRQKDGVFGRACCFTLCEAGVDYGSGCERVPEASECTTPGCWERYPSLSELGL